jgi:hypothetical protein
MEDLVPLVSLPLLETLVLKGNFVTLMPNYRAQVRSNVPKCKRLPLFDHFLIRGLQWYCNHFFK